MDSFEAASRCTAGGMKTYDADDDADALMAVVCVPVSGTGISLSTYCAVLSTAAASVSEPDSKLNTGMVGSAGR